MPSRQRAADLVRFIEKELDGELEADEVAAINGIYAPFSGGSPGRTTAVGVTTLSSASDAAATVAIRQGQRERERNAAICARIKVAGERQAAMWNV